MGSASPVYPFGVRAATGADLDVLVLHRRAMFRDMGHGDEKALETMSAAYRAWLAPRLHSGEYRSWVAVGAGQTVAAGAGLWLMDWPPHMVGGNGRRGNLLNVYTAPEFRRQGLARRLTHTALEWCRENEIGLVILHASEEGRALYQRLGFTPTNEMRLMLDATVD